MSRPATVTDSEGSPKSLSAASLWKRTIVGILILIFGIFGAAWVFDASIQKSTARFAAPGLSSAYIDNDAP